MRKRPSAKFLEILPLASLWLTIASNSAFADPVALDSGSALVSTLRQFNNAVLFIGHGSNGQYKNMPEVERQIDKMVRNLDSTYGKGKWAAVFGGDNFNAEKPDISHVMKYLKDKYRIPIVAVQSDIVIPWGGVDKYIDYVRYVPTVQTPVLDSKGQPVLENGKPKMKTHWGGFIDGKPRGPTEFYLGQDLIGGKNPILKDVVAVGGGPIGLDEAKYAYSHGVHVTYIRAETRFPEVNGRYGPVDDWVARLRETRRGGAVRCLVSKLKELGTAQTVRKP